MFPPCFPPVSTVRSWFHLWRDNRLWQTLNQYLLMVCREANGRQASLIAGIMDSQSVQTTESSGPCGAACPCAGKAGPGDYWPEI